MNAPAVSPVAVTTVLRLEGRDAAALLHRISTQSLLDLAPGEARWTLFCDYRGRLVHRALVAMTADRALWLLRDDAPEAELAAHVHRHVFREDVRIGLAGTRWRARVVTGATAVEPGRVREREGAPVMVGIAPGAMMALEPPGGAADDPAAERARIAAGRPRHGHEIAEPFNPYEVGLAHEVHLAKGCYTGQEALQRLLTYDSVRRRLVRVEGGGLPPPVPVSVEAGGDSAGVLTSAVETEDAAGWIGLAVLAHGALDGTAPLAAAGRRITRIAAFEPTRALGRR